MIRGRISGCGLSVRRMSAPNTRMFKKTHLMPKQLEIDVKMAYEVKSATCNVCGKPALRRFQDPKIGPYGRCKAHIEGGVIPIRYKRV